jgi:hypothetical protein
MVPSQESTLLQKSSTVENHNSVLSSSKIQLTLKLKHFCKASILASNTASSSDFHCLKSLLILLFIEISLKTLSPFDKIHSTL